MTILPSIPVSSWHRFVWSTFIRRFLETGIQSAIVIKDSATATDFVDDNSVVSAEVSSGHIEAWTDSAVHGTVPSEDAYIISI